MHAFGERTTDSFSLDLLTLALLMGFNGNLLMIETQDLVMAWRETFPREPRKKA